MKYLKKITALTVLLLVFSIAFSQNHKIEHPLDKEYQKCLQENLGNLSERICHREFEDKWDKEMNQNYNGLIEFIEMHMNTIHVDEALDSITLTNLRTSQRQWLKYRDAEFKLISKIYDRKGSMYYTLSAKRRMNFVRTRAIELMYYRNTFQ